MICNVKRKLLPRIRCKRVLFNLLYFETSAYQVQISSNSPSQKNTVGPELDKFLEIEIFHLIMAIVMTPVLTFLVLLVLNRANSFGQQFQPVSDLYHRLLPENQLQFAEDCFCHNFFQSFFVHFNQELVKAPRCSPLRS